jgi:preprotein translocase subunit YajC
MNILFSEAFAQSVQNSTQNQFSFVSLVPLILIFIIFYFLIIRPQTKKIKDHENMVNGLKIGNKIITSSGIIGYIRQINTKENLISLEIAENVVIEIQKNNIAEIYKNSATIEKTITEKKDKKNSKK